MLPKIMLIGLIAASLSWSHADSVHGGKPERPFKMQSTATMFVLPDGMHWMLVGSGVGTHTGLSTVVAWGDVGGYIAHGTLTAANGDTIDFVGIFNMDGTITQHWVGGTGRFAGASGQAIETFVPIDEAGMNFDIELIGTISY